MQTMRRWTSALSSGSRPYLCHRGYDVQAAATIPKSKSGEDLVTGPVRQAAERGTFSSTTSWPRAATQGQDARPSLFQAFPDAGGTLSPGSPTQQQLQQRTASERLVAMRAGSMLSSPTSSWNRSIMHVRLHSLAMSRMAALQVTMYDASRQTLKGSPNPRRVTKP